MGVRAAFQSVIDQFQFWFDIFPGGDYQPLPWIGIHRGRRAEGTRARWEVIRSALFDSPVSSGMDIGCNMGYFCFELAQNGIPMLGVDMDSRYLRIAKYARYKIGLQKVALSEMEVNTETVCLLPVTDLVLLLSVWHHWVKVYGLDEATTLLALLWDKCGKIMFFETGEAEMTPDFGLSFLGNSPRAWLESYLAKTCPNSVVTHLGRFKAFAPRGNETRNVAYRNLFKICRKTE